MLILSAREHDFNVECQMLLILKSSPLDQKSLTQLKVLFHSRFFNFGGQVKKKGGATAGACASGALGRRRGSDRSLSGSAHELALCAAQPPRAPDAPSHSHSQSNLAEIPFRCTYICKLSKNWPKQPATASQTWPTCPSGALASASSAQAGPLRLGAAVAFQDRPIA